MTANNNSRIASVDVVRGLIMVIMALDHTREFFHIDGQVFQPTDLTRTTVPLFFTRWITHFCAPTFVLLSGLAIRLRLEKIPRSEMRNYLLSRGFWLILLEVTVFRFILFFNFYYEMTFFTVLWTIGACMAIMAAIIYLNDKTVLILSSIILVGHQLTDLIPVANDSALFVPWLILLKFGFVPPAFVFTYPIIPWLAVMMFGYWLGRLYLWYPGEERRKILLLMGISMVALFVIVRSINVYGDPSPWKVMEQPFFTVLSFLNASKYPISLAFALMTLGPVLILLSRVDGVVARPNGFLMVIGREPLFYFLIHFLLIHIGSLSLYLIMSGKGISELDMHLTSGGGLGGVPAGNGISLAASYVAWVVVVTIMYLLCRWYARYKRANNNFTTRWI